jgi:D-alanyl-D-alanine carboxypeptidase (penicillin-binding protein 5/6)
VLSSLLIVGLLGAVILTYSTALDRTMNRGGNTAGATEPTPTVEPDAGSISASVEETPERAAEQELPGLPDGITAQSVYVLNASTGEAVRASNENEQRAIASLTKMMTALVIDRAIANGSLDLDDEVTIEAGDTVDAAVYSHMGLVEGDTVTIGELLKGMLIPSGNDAAKALARIAEERISTGFGDDGAFSFVDAMNEEAAKLGLEQTHFSNPDGDDDPDNYSSARDLAVMAQAVLASPLLAPIVATGSETVYSTGPERREYLLYNTNQLLQGFGFDGVKTGTTEAAGACLVASAELETGDRVIIVVLGSDLDPADPEIPPADWPRYADALAIYDQLANES